MFPAESYATLLAPLKYVEKTIVGSTAAAAEPAKNRSCAAKNKKRRAMGRPLVCFIQLYSGTPIAKSRTRETNGLQAVPGLLSRRLLTQRVEYVNAPRSPSWNRHRPTAPNYARNCGKIRVSLR